MSKGALKSTFKKNVEIGYVKGSRKSNVKRNFKIKYLKSIIEIEV